MRPRASVPRGTRTLRGPLRCAAARACVGQSCRLLFYPRCIATWRARTVQPRPQFLKFYEEWCAVCKSRVHPAKCLQCHGVLSALRSNR